jgi:DNA-binding MarR family transcriptional regulator
LDAADGQAEEITDLDLFHQLHLLKRLLNRARVGQDHTQARLLAHINRQGSVDQQELLRIYPVRAATMSQFLLKLERQGLITRPRQASDQRRRNVEITEAGRAESKARESNYQSNLDQFFSCLTLEERRCFKAILVKLNERFVDTLRAAGVDLDLVP